MNPEQYVIVEMAAGGPIVQARYGTHVDRAVADRVADDLNRTGAGTFEVLPISELPGAAR